MTRRGFFATASGIAVAVQATKGSVLGWGYMDVQRCFALRTRGITLRVHFNGVDVTDRCFEADDQLGYVGLYKHRDGRPYVEFTADGARTAREVRHGSVEFVRQ